MPSERVQRRIDGLLDQAEEAVEAMDWARALEAARAVLLVDPGNEDSEAFLTMAEGSLSGAPGSPFPAGEGGGEGERLPANLGPSRASGHGGASGPELSVVLPLPVGEGRGEGGPSTSTSTPTSFANGRYNVSKFLGEGGKKRVYLAHDTLLDREVAFALIKTDGLDQTSRARITREAQAMGRLGTHPNIVTVFDLGVEGADPYMVTELMGGGDVEGLLEMTTPGPSPDSGGGQEEPFPWEGEGLGVGRNGLSLERIIEIGKAVCDGLEFAHSKQIVHRDLKPANVWLTGDGVAKIGDFGLAMMTDRSRLTREGSMAGTPYYMPPEQAVGGDITPRADLYSLGAMLYEMVTGRPPFLGDDDVAIIGQHINTAPVAPTWHNGRCPRPLEALIMRLLAKDPSERPESARDAFNALDAIDLTARGETVEREGTSLESLAGGVFVGRQAEMGQLKSALEDVLGGSGRLVTLVGEPGIGKTRTSEELATYAALRGADVLWGRCYETGGQPPYWPWAQAIRSYVREAEPEELRRQMGSSAPVIAEIVPDVKDRLSDLQSPSQMDDSDSARFRLFDAITSFLKSASRAKPLVLVLDDLHWSDRPSLTFLEFVAREIGQSRLLIVATYRDMELNRRHPLSVTLGDLSRERLFERVLLRGLAEPDIARFIEIASGINPPTELAATIRRHTEGNPLFVTEVVRDLVQSGELAESVNSGTTTWSVRIPEGVREVIGRRLDRLSERANEVLTTAAVVGRDFRLDTLKTLLGPSTAPPLPAGEGRGEGEDSPASNVQNGESSHSPPPGFNRTSTSPAGRGESDAISENQLLDVLDEALDARIIEELSDGIGHYQFTHALMQETLTSELSLTRRVRFHARIAEALESLYGDQAENHASELAYHFAEAEAVLGPEKLLNYSVIAGEEAMAAGGPETAQAHFEKAESALPGTDSPLSGRVWFGLGITGAANYGPERAQSSLDNIIRAFDWFLDHDDPGMAVKVATYPVSIIGASSGTALLYRRALALVPPDSADAGWLNTRLSISLYTEEDDFGGIRKAAERALGTARQLGDLQMEARAHYGIGFADIIDGDFVAALRDGESVVELAQEIDDPQSAIRGVVVAWPSAIAVGDLSRARQLAEIIGESALRVRDSLWMRVAASNKHDCSWLAGEAPDDQIAGTDESGLNPIGWAKAETGDPVAIREFSIYVENGVASIRPRGLLSNVSRLAGMAYTLRADEHWERIRMTVEARGAHVDREGRPGSIVALLPLAIAAIRTRDAESAAELFESHRSMSGMMEPWAMISYDRVLGLLAATFGDAELADHHFNAALAFAEKAGYVRETVWAQMEYAEALLERGTDDDREKATQLQDAALVITQEIGMGLLTERILARRDILRA